MKTLSLFLSVHMFFHACAPTVPPGQSGPANSLSASDSSALKRDLQTKRELAQKLAVGLGLTAESEALKDFDPSSNPEHAKQLKVIEGILSNPAQRPTGYSGLRNFCDAAQLECTEEVLATLDGLFGKFFSNYVERGESALALTGAQPAAQSGAQFAAQSSESALKPPSTEASAGMSAGFSDAVIEFSKEPQTVAFAPLIYVGAMAFMTLAGIAALHNVNSGEAKKIWARENAPIIFSFVSRNQTFPCKDFDDKNTCNKVVKNITEISKRFGQKAQCVLKKHSDNPKVPPSLAVLMTDCSADDATARGIRELILKDI